MTEPQDTTAPSSTPDPDEQAEIDQASAEQAAENASVETDGGDAVDHE